MPTPACATSIPCSRAHFRTHELAVGGDLVTGRRLLVANDDVRILYAAADLPSALYRNAIGDELVYIEDGQAVLESVFGALAVGAGDYVVIPTSTTHRFVPQTGVVRALIPRGGRSHSPTPPLSLLRRPVPRARALLGAAT